MHLKVFYIQIYGKFVLNEKHRAFFLIKTMVYRKKIFIFKNTFYVNCAKIIELHVHTRRHMQSE